MKLRVSILGLITFLICFSANAQKEANTWFFGDNIGLDFSTGEPIPVASPAMKTVAGCAVASDNSGQLMFYTNGETIWNRNHAIMPNGGGLNGSRVARQSALIVPVPKQSDKFYVFTLSHIDFSKRYASLNYSIVNMNADSGLGVVETKNILLVDHVIEKQIAVPHANGNDFWLITHEAESDSFLTYLISTTGITGPTKYPIGSGYFSANQNVTAFSGSVLKASPDGKLLATAIYNSSDQSSSDFVKGPVELFDFDSGNGAIANYRNIGRLALTTGVSFSPDNTKLYVYGTDIEYLEASGENHDVIYQWDLSLTSLNEIIDSKTSLFSLKNTVTHIGEKALGVGGDLQIAPDGKIYAAGNITIADASGSIIEFSRNSLFVIQRPNEKGFDSNITIRFFNFGSGRVSVGLPNFIQSYFNGLEPSIPCNSENSFMLYPNPTSGSFKIIVSQNCFQPYTVSVYTILGQKVFEQSISSSDSGSVDISHLAQGTYIVLSDLAGRISRKIVKVN